MNNEEKRNPDWLPQRFTSDNQPPGAAKSAGWAKRRRNKELAQYLLGREFVGKSEAFRAEAARYFGFTAEEMSHMTNEAVIMMKQIGQAIESGDMQAAQLIMERAYGKPKEHVDIEDDEAKKPQIIIQVLGVGVDIPEIKTNENDINENLQPDIS